MENNKKSQEVPETDEYLEAMQTDIDKKRYEYINSLSKEEKEKFKKLEECVSLLHGLDCSFILLAAVEKDDNRFWRYHRFSKNTPETEEEKKEVTEKIFSSFISSCKFYSDVMKSSVIVLDSNGVPYYMTKPDGFYQLSARVSKP